MYRAPTGWTMALSFVDGVWILSVSLALTVFVGVLPQTCAGTYVVILPIWQAVNTWAGFRDCPLIPCRLRTAVADSAVN